MQRGIEYVTEAEHQGKMQVLRDRAVVVRQAAIELLAEKIQTLQLRGGYHKVEEYHPRAADELDTRIAELTPGGATKDPTADLVGELSEWRSGQRVYCVGGKVLRRMDATPERPEHFAYVD